MRSEIDAVRWPVISQADRDALMRVLDSGKLVGGTEAGLLEKEWAAYNGSRYCVAVTSCTHAIHLALRTLNIGEGDEVIVPALTFCGTAAPVVNCGATPVFADVTTGTYEIDPDDLRRKLTSRTRAIIPVHVHGLPANVIELGNVVGNIPVIEDACQAHGAELYGRKTGTLGVIGCFSLNQVKPLGGGQGGLVVTDDSKIADRMRLLASHGGQGQVGLCYGITEFAAALARSQLTRLDENNERARANARVLSEALCAWQAFLPEQPAGRVSVWHKYRLMLPEGLSREDAFQALQSRGVPCEL